METKYIFRKFLSIMSLPDDITKGMQLMCFCNRFLNILMLLKQG